ncbi:MAG: barstar family protein [Candidatus Howiella sp.]|jgi:RNAse (barnase) inhibitor barstar
MEEKKIVTLDLTGRKYLGEIHQRIKKAFDFPDFYGENWDAFWDLLRTECDADKVVVLGEEAVSEELKPSVKMIYEILKEFQEHHAKYGDQVEIKIHS